MSQMKRLAEIRTLVIELDYLTRPDHPSFSLLKAWSNARKISEAILSMKNHELPADFWDTATVQPPREGVREALQKALDNRVEMGYKGDLSDSQQDG